MTNRKFRIVFAALILVSMAFGQTMLLGQSVPGVEAAPTFRLPWKSGERWYVTADNASANHNDPAFYPELNRYAFDAQPLGADPSVVAIAEGEVIASVNNIEYSEDDGYKAANSGGNCVAIDHGGGVYSAYAHMETGSVSVQVGTRVEAGQAIGRAGRTGFVFASSPLLHWTTTSTKPDSRCLNGLSSPSAYADVDGDGIPRAGNYYVSANGSSSNVQPPSAPDNPTDCNDAGIPQITNGLSYSPENPDTATEVTFAFTIKNIGCGTFQPELLIIGGRDPSSNVSDPLQIPGFTLGPDESREITHTVVLNTPGTHEFFMVFLRAGGGYNEIPDTSGVSQHIYINVTEATEGEADPPSDSVDLVPMDIGATGPNGHEIGAQFTVTTEDGEVLGSCTLEGQGDEPYPVTCRVDVPLGTTVTVTLDESTITPGTVPVENPLYFDTTASEPGAASHWGVFFQVEAQGGNGGISQTSDVAIVTTENGQPATDVCFKLVGYGNEGCDRNDDGMVTFEDLPLGTYTVQQTADLGSGRSVEDFSINVTGEMQGGWETFEAEVVLTGSSSNPGSSSASGAVDIALITREPENGDLLTGACYVVGQSNEGCDENGDGQVTFADIPFGTYTVHQTQTPEGYPTINDFEIVVERTGYMEGPSFGVPLGFIVKQASEQNAPDTRNVSVVFLDMATHERVTSGACVELVGASNIGCDRDLVDGQVDFLDVPAGGPYELSFSNLPDGYQVGEVGGPLAAIIDAGPGDPSNQMIFVLLAGSAGAGSNTIEPADGNSADDSGGVSPDTGGPVEVTVHMTFRGCPEGFVPEVDDPYTACTIPLDAPDASLVGEWGAGQSLVPITGLERQYDGSYVFQVSSDHGLYLELTGLEPVVRDDFLIYGVDDQDGSSYIALLDNGETLEIFVFYYYD